MTHAPEAVRRDAEVDLSDDIRDYDFALPERLIAQSPAAQRESARLLVVRREPGPGQPRYEDLLVEDLPRLALEEPRLRGALWLRNRSRVIPARFYARRPSGGVHEIVLVSEVEPGLWKALVRRQARMDYPQRLKILARREGASLEGNPEDAADSGLEILSPAPGLIDLRPAGIPAAQLLEQVGEMPLPPYITERSAARDRERYQAIWARRDRAGSAAAPTASLHFTEDLCGRLTTGGADFADMILHVGLGTFEPLRQNSIAAHDLHEERFEVGPESIDALEDALGERPIIPIGSTALRTLESLPLAGLPPSVQARLETATDGSLSGASRHFIRPGTPLRYATSLMTNFHLPQSTLLVLVATFCGSRRLALEAYGHAVNKGYRFFSYGDATLWI